MVLSRLAQGVVVLAVTSLIVFAALCQLPGDPLELAVALDPNASPDEVARVASALDLDRPWPARYVAWLWGHPEPHAQVRVRQLQPISGAIDGSGSYQLDVDVRPFVDGGVHLAAAPGALAATLEDGHLRARLPPGPHRVVFVATDDAGQSAAGCVDVQVDDLLPTTAPEHDVTDIDRQLAGGTESSVEQHARASDDLERQGHASTRLLAAPVLTIDVTLHDMAIPRASLWQVDGDARGVMNVSAQSRDPLLDVTLDDDALHVHARGPGQGVVLVTRSQGDRTVVTAVNVQHGVRVDDTRFHRGAVFVLLGDVDAWGTSRLEHAPALHVVAKRLGNTAALVMPCPQWRRAIQ